jgi:hypothetical protein
MGALSCVITDSKNAALSLPNPSAGLGADLQLIGEHRSMHLAGYSTDGETGTE